VEELSLMPYAKLKIGQKFRWFETVLMKTNAFVGADLRINAISEHGILAAWFDGPEEVVPV
jgi:hypothetical protein